MNPYLKNLNRIEFMITLACTGRCKHCSLGDPIETSNHLDGDLAADALFKIASLYRIDSLMTFGGEPLLYPDAVCKIHAAARSAGIAERTVITNGFFSRDEARIRSVARSLVESGVNKLLLSVDAFHQETIPLEPVRTFAKALLAEGLPEVYIHPAWLVSADDDNPYNRKTKEFLSAFHSLGILTSAGNVIFPSGNALKYLGAYFDLDAPPQNPYEDDPYDITSVCIEPNGDLLDGNLQTTGVLEILKNYAPPKAEDERSEEK